MDFERLNAFQTVAREKSFSKAAQKLFKTQPAISQAIRSLEEELGEPLFVRLGRTIQLTQAGQILLEHAQQAFQTLEQGRVQIEALRGLRKGMLTIGASDTTACYILPPTLRVFRRRYPGIEILISNRPSPGVLEQVLSREVDIGMVTLPLRHPKIVIGDLLTREDVVICSPRHPLSDRTVMELGELEAYPLLLLDRGSHTRSFIDRRLEEAGITPNIAMELGSIEVIKRLVQLDFGVSIVPHVAVQAEIERGALCSIRVFDRQEMRRLGVIYLRGTGLSLAAQTFLELLTETLNPSGKPAKSTFSS